MSYHMPSVNLTRLSKFHRSIVEPLVDHRGKLVTCPPIRCGDTTKLIHNHLLKLLRRCPGWSVPLPYAWQMPHICRKIDDLEMALSVRVALEVFDSGCLTGRQQPIIVEDKVYLCRNGEDDAFYITIV